MKKTKAWRAEEYRQGMGDHIKEQGTERAGKTERAFKDNI